MSNDLEGRAAEGNSVETAPAPTRPRSLRVWPAVLLVILMILARLGPAQFEGGLAQYWMISVFGPILCCILLLLWWLIVSRARWQERVLGLIGVLASLAAVLFVADPTMRGPGTTYLTAPMGMIGFALGAVLFRSSRPLLRTSAAVVLALAGFSYSALLRNHGMTGDYVLDTSWRWARDAEKELVAAKPRNLTDLAPAPTPKTPLSTNAAEWAEFRGPDRAGKSSAPAIATNWGTNPPKQLWKISVGPGWSSFAVAGQALYTQEQRGSMEVVVAYDKDTGGEIWRREFEARLEDPLGGPGPRATPTLAGGALFAVGATGHLLKLDPATGEILWRRELTNLGGRPVPMWGFAGSPVVTDGLVIAYAGGPDNKGVLGVDTATGELRWSAHTGADSYSSPQLSTVAGTKTLLMLSNEGLLLLNPLTGQVQLNYDWKAQAYRALQPAVVNGDTILIQTPMNIGTRAIKVTRNGEKLGAEELWTSKSLKTDFSDLVTFGDYAFGNDAGMLACIDLKTGDRKWKGGRYGKGQILLLEKSGLLLILSEQGQVVLVPAQPTEPVEVASFKALEGKTWNHPVVVNDRLYVRNSEQAAAYVLPLNVK